MQISRFVVAYEGVREDENVLYDVLSDRYVGVNDAVLALVRRIGAGEAPADGDEAEVVGELHRQGFLVDGRAMEDQRLREHLARVAGGMPGTMYVTLMPTLACNLACTYCFQKDSPSFDRMTSETEAATLDFILRKVDEAGTPKLMVHYFGGEPLTRKDFVLRTAEALSAAMAARGGAFSWEMTTNGINLDRPFVEAMNRFGDGIIKITFDGDRETHDQLRVYRNGKGSFDVIFENVIAVAGAVRLRVGGNFLPDQEESYTRLVERLAAAGVLDQLDAVKFKPVMPTAATEGATCTSCSATAKDDTETLIRLDRLVRRKRSDARSETLEGLRGPCELHWDNQFIVDPGGLVYKCPAVAGRPEVAVGSVTGGALRGAPLLELRPWERHAPCHDCAYLPVCMGGCLGAKYLETHRRDQVNCKKEWLEALFAESVPRRYLQELGAAPWDGEGTAAVLPLNETARGGSDEEGQRQERAPDPAEERERQEAQDQDQRAHGDLGSSAPVPAHALLDASVA
jgi:uncharacterized protein